VENVDVDVAVGAAVAKLDPGAESEEPDAESEELDAAEQALNAADTKLFYYL